MRGSCHVSTRGPGPASVSFICSVEEKGPLRVQEGGSNPPVTGQSFLMSLECLPDYIRFYCVFTRSADSGSQFGSETGREKSVLRSF